MLKSERVKERERERERWGYFDPKSDEAKRWGVQRAPSPFAAEVFFFLINPFAASISLSFFLSLITLCVSVTLFLCIPLSKLKRSLCLFDP